MFKSILSIPSKLSQLRRSLSDEKAHKVEHRKQLVSETSDSKIILNKTKEQSLSINDSSPPTATKAAPIQSNGAVSRSTHEGTSPTTPQNFKSQLSMLLDDDAIDVSTSMTSRTPTQLTSRSVTTDSNKSFMQPPNFNGNIASIDHVVGIDYTKLNSKPIYEGANGIVFKGTNRNQRDILVIKTIKKQANHSNDNYSALVFKEYNNVKQCLGCKQIINVLDLAVNEEANEVSLIIPYYPRGDLLDYLSQLRKNKIELNSNLKDAVFKQIVKGVNFLHERNIVHRDLKPENCLIDEDGTIRLSDFGYTLDLNKIDEQIKLNDICCGTTSFKAPELFDYERLIDSENYLGYLEKIDFKALDCWSLGIFYFQIYLMRVPWNDADLKNDSSNKTYHKYAKHYPSDENLLNSLINQLDDKNFNMQYNPALAIFKKLHHESRFFIFSLLNPQPDKRLDANSLLNSNWLNQVYANSKDFIELLPNKKR